ncbi:hypothetical protein Tco_1331234, partial [Tanacetum coccineum]
NNLLHHTPLKLADYFKISGVYNLGGIQDNPTGGDSLQTVGMPANFKGFMEVVFEYPKETVQMDGGRWLAASRTGYNLRDTISRVTPYSSARNAEVKHNLN